MTLSLHALITISSKPQDKQVEGRAGQNVIVHIARTSGHTHTEQCEILQVRLIMLITILNFKTKHDDPYQIG